MTHENLEQQLWELEYGLLSVEEGAALRRQVASDPEAARLQARVRAHSSLVSQAARMDGPRQVFRAPAVNQPSVVTSNASQQLSTLSCASTRMNRIANWTLGIATSLLIGLLGWMSWTEDAPGSRPVALSTIGIGPGGAGPGGAAPGGLGQPVRSSQPSIVITCETPAQVSLETTNFFSISTTTSTGSPQSVGVQVRGESKEGESKFSKSVVTDKLGQAQLALSGREVGDAIKLNLALIDGNQGDLQVALEAAKPQYVTRLQTDKPQFRPGETVRYRSVTLTRFGLQADRDVTVDYSVTDPNGQEIATSKLVGVTSSGVGNGEFPLAATAVPGQYTLFARNPDLIFPEVKLDFDVRQRMPRLVDIEVNWNAGRYAPEARARAELLACTPDGQPAADVKLALRAFVDGRQLELPVGELTTDRDGKGNFDLQMPSQIASSSGELGIEATGQEVVWREIPLQANQVQVEFYPEGGDLVAGVENRVYFHAHDLEGRPIAIRGRVLADGNRVVSAVTTQYEGRGSFRCTPEVGVTQSLVVDDPPNIQSQPKLPPATEAGRLVLDAGPGVFGGPGPLRVRLKSQQPPSNFTVVANCRGVTVGHQSGVSSSFVNGECELLVPVAEEATGVVRLTVFDYSQLSPEPLAERLVYRKPTKTLSVQLKGLAKSYSPGDKVRGEVESLDETGQPIPALLGISVVDEVAWQWADQAPPRLPTQFLLLGDVARTDKLEDVNFLLSEDSAASEALDLLLATQGWRRFDRVSASRMAGMSRTSDDRLAYAEKQLGAPVAGQSVAGDGDLERPAVVPGLGLQPFLEVADDAPRRHNNLAAIAATEEIAGVLARTNTLQENLIRSQPAQSPAPERSSTSPRRFWISGLLAIIVVLSAALGWRRNRGTARGIFGILVVSGVLAFGWSLREAVKASNGVTVAGTQTSASQFGRTSKPASLDFVNTPDATEPLPELESMNSALRADRVSKSVVPPPTALPALAPALAPSPSPVAAPRATDPAFVAPPPPAPKSALERMPQSSALAEVPTVRAKGETGSGLLRRQAGVDWFRKAKKAPATIDQPVKELREKSEPARQSPERGRRVAPVASSATPAAAPGATPESALGAKDEKRDLAESLTPFYVRRYAYVKGPVAGDRSPRDFAETVYWNPLLLSDGQGRATFEFDLPDTATNFRISVDGHRDGRLGEEERTVTSQLKK